MGQPDGREDVVFPDPLDNAHGAPPEPHILVVEDGGETRRLLVRLLRENGLDASVQRRDPMAGALPRVPRDLVENAT